MRYSRIFSLFSLIVVYSKCVLIFEIEDFYFTAPSFSLFKVFTLICVFLSFLSFISCCLFFLSKNICLSSLNNRNYHCVNRLGHFTRMTIIWSWWMRA